MLTILVDCGVLNISFHTRARIEDIVSCCAVFPSEASEDGKLNVLFPRILYCLIQAGGLAFGLWKLNTMGLLPTHASDYVSSLKVPVSQEFSTGGVHILS